MSSITEEVLFNIGFNITGFYKTYIRYTQDNIKINQQGNRFYGIVKNGTIPLNNKWDLWCFMVDKIVKD